MSVVGLYFEDDETFELNAAKFKICNVIFLKLSFVILVVGRCCGNLIMEKKKLYCFCKWLAHFGDLVANSFSSSPFLIVLTGRLLGGGVHLEPNLTP